MFITVPLAWVLHGTKSSADAVSPWNSVISRCSVSMELGHQQMQCSLQTHTYFLLCSVGNFYKWIRISFFTVWEQLPSSLYCTKMADRENGDNLNRWFHHVVPGIISCGWYVQRLCYIWDTGPCIFCQTASNRQVVFRPRIATAPIERLSLSAFLGTEDIGVHISCVIITYLYIGIIIFPHIDNPQSSGCNSTKWMTESNINDIFNYGDGNSYTFWVACKHFESFVYARWVNYEGTIQQPCQHISAVAVLHCCFVKKCPRAKFAILTCCIFNKSFIPRSSLIQWPVPLMVSEWP